MRLGTHLCAATLMALAFAPLSLADSWQFEQQTRIYKFGKGLEFRLDIDPVDRGNWAKFTVRIRNGAALLARHEGISFDELFASPDESLFVGLSNSGIPGTAVVVFNRSGQILLLAAHDAAEFDYCDKSIYIVRSWHGSEKGDVQFDDETSLAGITLRNCRGERVNLLRTVAEAYERALAQKKPD
jgi:hypothetical protein